MKDRLIDFFSPYANEYVFVEIETLDFPIPLKSDDIKKLAENSEISTQELCQRMLRLVGINPAFPLADKYLQFCKKVYGEDLREILVETLKNTGSDVAPEEILTEKLKDTGQITFPDLIEELIMCRLILKLDEDNYDALYAMALICKSIYNDSDDEEKIGLFKAESIDCLEKLTTIYPEADMPWYHLAYSYLNLGLYTKSFFCFKKFVGLSNKIEERSEAAMRMKELEEPVEIEKGINDILSGRNQKGLEILEKFSLDAKYEKWWPLSYYLGIAYKRIGRTDEAIFSFEKVLRLNSSHISTMKELIEIYSDRNDMENVTKYRRKVGIIKNETN